tara:strand:- start:479 stop:940 length:462 start_codon:yes stop_codon:yes gene_type:complete
LPESDEDEENLLDSDGEVADGTKKAVNFDKREKNIRRRVYDALNVQFAAGVLVKTDNKHIQPNEQSYEYQRILKMIQENNPNLIINSKSASQDLLHSTQQNDSLTQKRAELLLKIEELKKQKELEHKKIKHIKSVNTKKQKMLCKEMIYMACY